MPVFDAQAIKHAFGRAAPSYDEHARLQRRVRLQAVTRMQEYWRPGMQILDAGCGTGALSHDAKQQGWQITGLDLSPGMCAAAQDKIPAINADAGAMPFAEASFDGVFSSLMLQWAGDPLEVLHEMHRVLKPGGHCMVTTLTQGTLCELRDAFAMFDDTPPVSRFASTGEVTAAATSAGFTVLHSEGDTVVEYYADALAVMQSLKAIGATHKHPERRRGLMTPLQLARLNQAYAGREGQGVGATWQVLTLLLRK